MLKNCKKEGKRMISLNYRRLPLKFDAQIYSIYLFAYMYKKKKGKRKERKNSSRKAQCRQKFIKSECFHRLCESGRSKHAPGPWVSIK